jgi:hypothetical protein
MAAAPKKGVVVDFRAHAKTATVAAAGGRLIAVHTAKKARVGSIVKLSGARQLRNGTFAAKLTKVGRARHALVRAKVVARVGRSLMLSARGTTFAVKLRGKRSMEHTSTPPVGSTVVANVTIKDDGELEATDVNETAAPVPGQTLEIEGKLTAASATSLTVTTRDDGVSTDFLITVPAEINVSALIVGSEVELQVTVNPDGTFTLTQGSLNGDDNEADDPNDDTEHNGIYGEGNHQGGGHA